MNRLLVVGGTFDHNGGRPSGLVDSIFAEILKDASFEATCVNGGTVTELHDSVLSSVTEYQVVLWFANVSNDEVKLRDVKAINPRCMLVTSKRNDDSKYTFAELISRSLAIKANLTIEFSKREDKFNMMLFDPLGNVFYNGLEVEDMCTAMIKRLKKLITFTRVPTVPDIENEVPQVPDESEFFSFAHSCAEIFHNLIRPAKGTERFLGNMSFRCQNGFPSFRGKNGIIYVSRRNVDKSDIGADSFVPTYLDDNNDVRAFGEHKPSVDTPVQLRLYKLFPWANYMIHAHCYVDTTGISDSLMFKTAHPVPCGALEEVAEIYNTIPKLITDTGAVNMFNKNAPRLLAINLVGHGCILIAKDIEIFKELQNHKDNCFVQRPIPEAFNGVKLVNTETFDNTQADWLEAKNWPDWLKEDFLDLLNDYPDLYEMSKDDIEKTIRALRSTAQDFLDTANSLESQADLLARYLNEKV